MEPSGNSQASGTIRVFSIAVQAFSAFVAGQAVLGKIYHSTFLAELGLPSTAVPIEILRFTLLSPDVALLSVGVALSTVGYCLVSGKVWRYYVTKLRSGPLKLFAVLIFFAVVTIADGATASIPRGTLRLFFVCAFGAILVLFGPIAVPASDWIRMKLGGQRPDYENNELSGMDNNSLIAEYNRLRFSKFVSLGILLSLVVVFNVVAVTGIARLDAKRLWSSGATARLRLNTDPPAWRILADETSQDRFTRAVKMLIVTEDTLFVGAGTG